MTGARKGFNVMGFIQILFATLILLALFVNVLVISNLSRRKEQQITRGLPFVTKQDSSHKDPSETIRQLQTRLSVLEGKQPKPLSRDKKIIGRLLSRIQTLETKLDSFLAFAPQDPFQGVIETTSCKNASELSAWCPETSWLDDQGDCNDHRICLDSFPPKKEKCIIYDFGIRANPEFGEILSAHPFNCDVYAFDPSPITRKWYAESHLKNRSNYHLFHYGAGSADEKITLRKYDWDQISILQFPERITDPAQCNADGICKSKIFGHQKGHLLPVRSLSSIMKELHHDHVSIVKVDVEGSEYRFLEAAIRSGACRHINQLALEWHHFSYDSRYGTSSIPHINVIVALLREECGLEQFWVHQKNGGWQSNAKLYLDMGMDLRYNLASFTRTKKYKLEK